MAEVSSRKVALEKDLFGEKIALGKAGDDKEKMRPGLFSHPSVEYFGPRRPQSF